MPRAEIFLEDADDAGQGAAVRFMFPDGFDAKSPAHQLCNMLRQHLDDMAEAGELTALTEREEYGDMTAANDALVKVDE